MTCCRNQGLFYRAVLHKMCSSKPICAVLKTQMCRHQINKNLNSKQSSHLLVFLWMIQMSEMLSLSIKNLNVFWERTTRPSYFPHKSHTCWGNGTGVKIERSYPKEIREGEPNILCCLRLLLYIEYSRFPVTSF